MKRITCLIYLFVVLCPFTMFAQQQCNITVEGRVQNPSCTGGMDGAIQVQVKGGAAPYTYFWSNGQEVKNISSLTSGAYTLTVRDANGCVTQAEYKLKDNEVELTLLVEQEKAAGNKYTLKVLFKEGQKPYAITIKKLSDGVRAPITEYHGQVLADGIYLLEAFTKAGCSVMQKVIIGNHESSTR